METLVIFLTLLIVGVSSDWTGIGTNVEMANECITEHGRHRHGETYLVPGHHCRTYMCFLGRQKAIVTGCPHDGQCRRLETTWQARDCHTYTCRRIGPDLYKIDRLTTGCKDAEGRCHRSLERFSYREKNGNIRHGCTCVAIDANQIQYHCP